MQAIVDCNTRFLDILLGFLGIVHDAWIISNSSFKVVVDHDNHSKKHLKWLVGFLLLRY